MARARLPELEQHLLQHFPTPPDAATVADIAALYGMTPEEVWTAVRRSVPQGPISQRSVVAEPSRPRGFDAVVSAFRQHGRVKATKKGVVTQCPLHRDRRPSLIINRALDDPRVALLFCHSCKKKPGQLLTAVGLTAADCFPEGLTRRTRPVREIVAEYLYVSMSGVSVATKVRYRDRFSPKRFGWRVGDRWTLTDVEKAALPLYGERDLIECSTVYLVESEKAVDRLWAGGLPATCAPHGAGVWEPRWTENLRLLGVQHVVILIDNDAAGRDHGESVAGLLQAAQFRVQVVTLPMLKAGEDVYDWLVGRTVEELEGIVASTPPWSPELVERQRIEAKRTRWREKKRRQRENRRRRVPLRSSDNRHVPLCSQERQVVPPVPLSPLRTISIGTSKGDDYSNVSGEVDPLLMNREEDGFLQTSTPFVREREFTLEVHRGGDHDGSDDDDTA